MSNIARELLTGILANPLDDAPRFVLSDVLQERSDPRGLFIVAQCRLARRGLPPNERTVLGQQAAALLEANKATWGAAAVGFTYTMRRGFIDEVEATAADLVLRGKELFAVEPVTRLTVTDASVADLEALASMGAFARVTRLTIRGAIGDDGARVLAAALTRRTSPLQMLNLGGNEIGADGVVALVPSLTGCQGLALTSNPITNDGATAIASATTLARLETLYLTDASLTDDGVIALAKSSALTSLARLGLARNEDVTEEGLALLAKSKKLKRLRWLEYTNEDGAQEIATRPR